MMKRFFTSLMVTLAALLLPTNMWAADPDLENDYTLMKSVTFGDGTNIDGSGACAYTAYDTGNKKQQTLTILTAPADAAGWIAMQAWTDGSGKGWWNRADKGLYCVNAGRSACVFGDDLTMGWLVVFECTQTASNVMTLINGAGEPDGTFSYVASEDGNSYFCTITASENAYVGFCGNKNAGFISKISVYKPNQAAVATTYTVNYVDMSGNPLKDPVTYNAIAGNSITLSDADKANITIEETTYVYDSDDSEGKVIAGDGTTAVTVKFHAAANFAYSVNEVCNGTIARATNGISYETADLKVGYRKYNAVSGQLYTMGATNKEYNYSFKLTQDNQVENITYSIVEGTSNVVFLTEGEDVKGLTICTSPNTAIRSSNSSSAYATEDTKIVTLSAGTYKIHAIIYDASKTPDSHWIFKAGATNVADFNCTTVNIQEFDSEEFTLTEDTPIYLAQGGNSNMGLDALYITGTGSVVADSGAEALEAAKVALQTAIAIATNINPEGFAEVIATAQAALTAEDATVESITQATQILENAIKAYFTEVLPRLGAIVQALNDSTLNAAYANAQATLAKDGVTPQELAAAMQQIITTAQNVAPAHLENLRGYAEKYGTQDAVTIVDNALAAIEVGNVSQIIATMAAVNEIATPIAQQVLGGIIAYVQAFGFTEQAAQAQAALESGNYITMITVAKELFYHLVAAAKDYLPKLGAIVQGLNDSTLIAAYTEAEALLAKESITPQELGAAMQKIITAAQSVAPAHLNNLRAYAEKYGSAETVALVDSAKAAIEAGNVSQIIATMTAVKEAATPLAIGILQQMIGYAQNYNGFEADITEAQAAIRSANYITMITVAKALYDKLIAAANAYVASVKEIPTEGKEGVDSLNAAITAAEQALAAQDADFSIINTAISNLVAAVAAFKAANQPTFDPATVIANASFEADGEKAVSNGPLELTGWTFAGVGGSYNNTELRPAGSTSTTSQFGSSDPKDGSYSLFFRQGWNGNGNVITLTSDALADLPSGDYILSVAYKQHYSYDNTTSNNTFVGLSLVNGETTIATVNSPAATGVNGGSADASYFNDTEWSTLELPVSLADAVASSQVVITLNAGGQRRSDFFIDDVKLVQIPAIDAALKALKQAIDAATEKAATYAIGDGLFLYPASEIEPLNQAIATAQAAYDAAASKEAVAAATEALNAFVSTFAPVATTPAADKAYTFQLSLDGETPLYMSLAEGGITIAEEATPLYFIEAETAGQYYLANEEKTLYVGLAGNNAWTMSTTADQKAAWTFTALPEGAYRINNLVTAGRFVGTNSAEKETGSPCYADKLPSNGNIDWLIAEATVQEPEFAYGTIWENGTVTTVGDYQLITLGADIFKAIGKENDTLRVSMTDVAKAAARVGGPMRTTKLGNIALIDALNDANQLFSATNLKADVDGIDIVLTADMLAKISAVENIYLRYQNLTVTKVELLANQEPEPIDMEGIIYSWESPEGTPIEYGGTIAYVNGDGDRLNYAQGGYYTICLNGKKANVNDETPSANAGKMVITLDKAVAEGDTIAYIAFINKNESKTASPYIVFENGVTAEGEVFGDEANINEAFNGVPTLKYTVVPAEAAGSKTITLTRSQAGTNLFIIKLQIIEKKAEPEPDPTPEPGTDMTSYIVNPSFEDGTTGWTYEPSNDHGAKDNNNATYTMTNCDGDHMFNIWSSGNAISQKVEGLPNGTYKLKAVIATDGGHKVQLNANGKSVQIDAVDKGTGVEGELEFNVLDGTATIGAEGVDKYWYKVDNFRLYFVKGFDIDALVAAYEQALADAKAVEGNMNAEVKAALEAAIAAEVDKTNAEALATATATLENATADAKASVAAYTNAANILPKMKELTENTNVYTAEAYEQYYNQWVVKYDAATLTTAEANALQDPFLVTGWHANITCDNFLLSAWDTNPDFQDAAYYINTWSVEGENDGSEFKVPFFEYWTGDDNSLGEKTLTATMNGLAKGTYDVKALVRVRIKNGVEAPAFGISLQINEGEAVDVAGDQVGTTQMYLKEVTASGAVDVDGVLKIKFIVSADNNISWLAFKNVKYEKNGTVGISNVNTEKMLNGTIYNLNGQKMQNPGKGLYIINGKKVVLK